MNANFRFILCLFLLILPFGLNAQQTINASITHGGLQREYILYVPASYTAATPAPLVLNFHGYTSNAGQQMLYGNFTTIADTAGFLLVHPEGTQDFNGNTHWNVGWGASTVDDVDFVDKLIDSLAAAYSVDQTRIYSTGMSNGGFMSYQLACQLSARIAAIASVTGSMTFGSSASCNPLHPMPVMEIHGTGDPTVAYNGSSFSDGIPDVMNFWANFNNCDTPPTVTNVPDTAPLDGSTVEHHVYPNGDAGVVNEHFKVINGGHTWPGAIITLPGTNYDINASAEIWRFFSQYDINGVISATEAPAPEKDVRVYPNPVGQLLSVEFASGPQSGVLRLVDLSGKPSHIHTFTREKTLEVMRSGLVAGMYMLQIHLEDGRTYARKVLFQ